MAQTGAAVDLAQVLSMFTPATRKGVAASTVGFSDALAGRGNDINNAIGAFVPLVTDLGPVARNLASSKTDFGGFFRGLGSLLGSARRRSRSTQATLYVNLDATFRSLATVAVPFLQNWISEQPPTYQTVIDDSPREQAVPDRHRGIVHRPATGLRHAAYERADPRGRVRRRRQEPSGDDRARPAHDQPREDPRELWRQPDGPGRPRSPDAHRKQPAPAAALPDSGAVHV